MRPRPGGGGSALLVVLCFVVISACGAEEEPSEASGTRAAEPRTAEPQDRTAERDRLVNKAIVGAGITDPAVVDAMRSVPRHEFVPPEHQGDAYADRPLPIGHGQTISQPYIVAYMTEVLQLSEDSKVLEVGTGSGYQAAVLAEIVEQVHTIEIIEPLAESAAERLERLGYDNIVVHQGDGYYGWPDAAPYDAVIVTAAAGHIPPPLIDQLAADGRMIIPVGPVHAVQQLILVQKEADGTITTTQLLSVRFVPMTGQAEQ